jgi:uroporphyrinogen III methyltransferase / synthase
VSGRGSPARVLVTRPRGQERELIRRLRERGYDAVHVPLIEIEPTGDDPIDVGVYDWVVVTSPNGARELRRRAVGRLPRLAAIGPATAAALGRADIVASPSTQEGLLAAMPRSAGRVLFAGAEGARTLLADELGADVVVLYRTRPLVPAEPLRADLVVLASASAASALGALRTALPAVSIGPETTRAARTAGIDVVAEATSHDLFGLVAAVDAGIAAIAALPSG